jgi:hypothetical protein
MIFGSLDGEILETVEGCLSLLGFLFLLIELLSEDR